MPPAAAGPPPAAARAVEARVDRRPAVADTHTTPGPANDPTGDSADERVDKADNGDASGSAGAFPGRASSRLGSRSRPRGLLDPPRRTGRTAAIASAGVLGVLLVAVLAVVVTRGDTPDPGGTSAEDAGTSGGVDTAQDTGDPAGDPAAERDDTGADLDVEAAAVDPSADDGADTTAQDASASATDASIAAPGPSSYADGVPVGFQRTDAGAIAAAANYITALHSKAFLVDAAFAERYFRQTAVEEELEETLSRLPEIREAADIDTSVVASPSFVYRFTPTGFRLNDTVVGDGQVRVDLWGVLVSSGISGEAAGEQWQTLLTTMRWEREDWRVVGIETLEGPWPPVEGEDYSVMSDAETINEFERFTYSAAPAD